MTKRQKQIRRWNRNAIAKRKAQGWRAMFYHLPPEVHAAVLEFKNIKMREWRDKQKSAPPLELVNEIVGQREG
jgi:hypothetical protein